jgi:hypothetical protein
MTTAMGPRAAEHGRSIDDADARLGDWVASLLDDVDVSFDPPAAAPAGRGVSLYLYEVRPSPPPRSRTPPLQATLRYLVTTWAPTQSEAHRMLGQLMFGALEGTELEVEPETIDISVWAMFATPPKPSFVLRVSLRRERDEAPVRMVRQALVVQTAALMPLRGTVVGPGDVPIAGARVEIPLANLAVATDRLGRFAFTAVAAGPHPTTIRVLAKGRQLTLTTDPGSREPLIIHFEPLEG